MKNTYPFIFLSCLLCSPLVSPDPSLSEQTRGAGALSQQSIDIHHSMLTIDSHIDIPKGFGDGILDPNIDGPMQVDFTKMQDGGLDAGFFVVYTPQDSLTEDNYARAYKEAVDKLKLINRVVEKNRERIALAKTPEELLRIHSKPSAIAIIGVENAYPLGNNLNQIEEFYQLGARYISLTHFGNNQFADSSISKGNYDDSEEPIHGGLSPLGYKAVAEMNRLGIMVDVSHTSMASTLQAVETSKAPVIASHSGAKGVFNHPRNLSDEEILAISEAGGVIQVVAYDGYMRKISLLERINMLYLAIKLGVNPFNLGEADANDIANLREAIAQLDEKFPLSTVSTVVDHIDYIVNLVGIEHVGIASDFGGGGGVVGWYNARQSPALTTELLKRGYTPEEIGKIWSGNLLRVWASVEKHSNNLRFNNEIE